MAFPGEIQRNAARLIVCEQANTWAIAFRRALAARAPNVRVVETRTEAECQEALFAEHRAIAALRWSPDRIAAQLDWVWRTTRSTQQPRILIVELARRHPHHWAFREAGAEHAVSSVREIEGLAPWIKRHFGQRAPRRFDSIEDEVAAGLPWAKFAADQRPETGDNE